jgi:hypothetical protein
VQHEFVANPAHTTVSFRKCADTKRAAFFCAQTIMQETCRWPNYETPDNQCDPQMTASLREFSADWHKMFDQRSIQESVNVLHSWLTAHLHYAGMGHLMRPDSAEYDYKTKLLNVMHGVQGLIGRVPLHTVCADPGGNKDLLPVKATREVLHHIFSDDECAYVQALFDKRMANKLKEHQHSNTIFREHEKFINFISEGPFYTWDEGQEPEARWVALQERLQAFANKVAMKAGLPGNLIADTIMVQMTPEGGHFPHSDSCRWTQPEPRTLTWEDGDPNAWHCTKNCADEGGEWTAGHTPQRIVSMSIPLNTGYEGGHFYFLSPPEASYKLNMGSGVAFTSEQVHQVEKVDKLGGSGRMVLLAWWKQNRTLEAPRPAEETYTDGIFTREELANLAKRTVQPAATIEQTDYDLGWTGGEAIADERAESEL